MAIYGRTLHDSFLTWDDDRHIVDNPAVSSPSWSAVASIWRSAYDHLYIPLSYTFFAAEAWISERCFGGLRPEVFHATSVALHAANVILVFLLLRRLVKSELAALVGAALFAVHPLQVESVAWISETRGLLAAFFSLIALNLYVRFLERRNLVLLPLGEGGRRSDEGALFAGKRVASDAAKYLIATVAFVLALLSKPTAAAVPLMALVLDRIWYRPSLRIALKSLAPWLLAAAAIIVVSTTQQSSASLEYTPGVASRLLIAGDALAFYLGKLVVPLNLGFDYGHRPQMVLSHAWGYLAWLVPFQIVLVLLVVQPRREWFAAAALTFVALLPNLGFIPFIFQDISTVADRYMYLPMLGVALAAALAIEALHSTLVLAVACLALGGLGALSAAQCAVWQDNASLYTHGLVVNPASFVARYNLGLVLQEDGLRDAAKAQYELALELKPTYAWAANALGVLSASAGRTTEAIENYRRALASDPKLAEVHVNLANALLQAGQVPAAFNEYHEALELAPRSTNAHCSFGEALVDMGRTAEGLEHLRKAVEINPRFVEARMKLGLVLAAQRQYAAAADEFRAALAVKPQLPEALVNLGSIAWQLNRFDEAERDYDEALAIDPSHADALFNKGCVLMERGQIKSGLSYFRRALDRMPPDSPKAQYIRDEMKKYE
ncbi:MAG TPA: tetratricopeptide repeat protein [Pirellulales bacterium]|nr:tetratricopeptide repeat protein [Pirellulales bacterium]